MPPRWLSLLIIAAWLATTGWLVWTDVLPRLMPGTPPAFSVLIVEEADQQRASVRWTASRNGTKTFTVHTQVKGVGQERYDLKADYEPYRAPQQTTPSPPVEMGGLLVSRFASTYRVNAEGDLLRLTSVIEGRSAGKLLGGVVGDFVARVRADVENGRMRPVVTVAQGVLSYDYPLAEASGPSRGGAVLMPLQPVNRLNGLNPGQRWTMTRFDPLGAVMGDGGKMLRGAVRGETEELQRGAMTETCLVIDYSGEGIDGATWVRQKDGLVLRQEAKVGNDRWVIVRE